VFNWLHWKRNQRYFKTLSLVLKLYYYFKDVQWFKGLLFMSILFHCRGEFYMLDLPFWVKVIQRSGLSVKPWEGTPTKLPKRPH